MCGVGVWNKQELQHGMMLSLTVQTDILTDPADSANFKIWSHILVFFESDLIVSICFEVSS